MPCIVQGETAGKRMQDTMTTEEPGGESSLHDLGAEVAALETQFDIVRYMRRQCEIYNLTFFMAFTLPGFEAEKLSAHSIISNWPPEVMTKYDGAHMVRHSASIRRLRLTTIPFSYDMAQWIGEADGDFSELGEAMKKHGMQVGHFFPVHDALGNRGAVVWSGLGETMEIRDRLSLQMISIHVFNRLAEIGAAWRSGQIVLTEREIQCLSWTAAGKTSLEIAEILGLSEHTVNHYLNQVTRKLEAVNRTQAVVKAIRRGLIA
ncbi:LuxR family transcriptional regulator [Rhizobium sp. TRM95111]|uniref:helix-turn-helix transcriptional regulator n=1 Tax=Rhizobium alarense TaxID=2846851 RepID=UPI001F4594B0|nr:LuxR family transcriptional regulator [Rhizobium alarense]MCF3642266.1 LuxR family transcriptional regulator [Rhizobium alarense]